MTWHRALRALRLFLFLAFIAVVCWLAWIYRADLLQLLQQHPVELAVLVILGMLQLAFQTWSFLTLMKSRGPGFLPTYTMWGIANLANYLGPFQVGLGVRIGFFKAHGVAVDDSTATTLRQLHLSLWVALGMAGIGLLWLDFPQTWLPGWLLLLCFMIWPFSIRLVQKWLQDTGPHDRFLPERARFFVGHALCPPGIIQTLLVSAQYIVVAVTFWTVYGAYDAGLSANQALLLAVVTTLSSLFTLLPNNLGVQEVLLASMAHYHGLGLPETIAIAFAIRAAHIAACFGVVTLGWTLQQCFTVANNRPAR